MTSATSQSAQSPPNATDAAATAPRTTSSPSGAVPAQLPVRSYANATKTATQTPPAAAGASAQNAKPSESPVNGSTPMAQGGSQAANNGAANGTADHGRKPSVVISASGASGYTPNGGPVGQNGARPPINFGSMNSGSSPQAQASTPAANLATPSNPRVISPAHSPSPIPQPQASGGRPPSNLQGQGNGVNFGSIAEGEQRQTQMPTGPQGQTHERRTSNQSMHSDMGNPNMNRGFPPNGRGRGGYPNQPYGMGSPAQNFRPSPAGRGNVPPQFQPPGSPYGRPRMPASPANMPSQPHMPQQHMGGNHMQYGNFQQQPMHGQGMYAGGPSFDPTQGYYPPYYYQGYQGQGQAGSPRPPYPGYPGPQGQMNSPYHPPAEMARTASQSSQRPPSSMGNNPGTPHSQHSQLAAPQSSTPGPQAGTPAPSSNFVRPVKKSNAIKITDANGNEVNFNKSSPAPSVSSQPAAPVIVSTPSAATPPPRTPSTQPSRGETKTPNAKSAEETKAAFQEQVKRQMEQKRTQDEAAKPKEAEKAPAAVEEKKPEEKKPEEKKVEEPAAKAVESKDTKEETEDERFEREIAEMEAAEKEEEEREKAYNEKKKLEKEAAAKVAAEKEKDSNTDDALKRQEREAEERELAREREREGGEKEKAAADGPDDEAKSMFASLKKATIGPGASASGTETPNSEDTDSASMPPPSKDDKKAKPTPLKLETNKRVEPAEPTPGMQSLKSARFLEIKEEPKYPEGVTSPNPALNGARKGRAYDKDFLMQFQSVFKEKPSVDWDQKVRDTLGPGDEPGSARGAGRTPSSGKASARGAPSGFGGVMGNFGGQPIRTLPAGTTSQQRFEMSQGGGRGGMAAPGRIPSNLGMGGPNAMSRTGSLQNMHPNSPRTASSRGGKGGSRRGDRTMSKREEADQANKMPLTAHMEIKALEKSKTGWQPTSLTTGPMANAPDPSGNMAPDMVQRKVKAALNKMTPEKFEKISDQILEIAGQSKNESDGRTLRQVIQLTFEKACDEAHWAGMYAQFCHKMLTTMSQEIRDETIKDKAGNPVIGGALFRKYLLNRCQEEFERGWQANLPDKPEGENQEEAALLSDEYYVAAAAKRRGLGLIQFIGQLYKLRMLTLRIMHECVMRLLNFEGVPDEAAVENLTTLLRSVGATMDEDEQGKALMNTYFQRIDEALIQSGKLGSRPTFMILDLVDLRKMGWKGKNDAKGPKTIEEIHAEAAAAQAKAEADRARTQRGGPGGGRMPQGRGDARNFSGGMAPPVDYSRTNVNMDDLRRLQNRGASSRSTGGGLGPGGSLGPGSTLGARSGSRRGNLGPPSSGHTTRTNTPPVGEKDKKEEPSTQTNAFSALAALDASGEGAEETSAEAPKAEEKAEESSTA